MEHNTQGFLSCRESEQSPIEDGGTRSKKANRQDFSVEGHALLVVCILLPDYRL